MTEMIDRYFRGGCCRKFFLGYSPVNLAAARVENEMVICSKEGVRVQMGESLEELHQSPYGNPLLTLR